MNPELDVASRYLDEALTAFAAGQDEEVYRCIQEAATILDSLGAALQPMEQEPQAQPVPQVVLAAAA